MLHPRSTFALLATGLFLVGCDEPTSLEPPAESEPLALTFTAPSITQADLVHVEVNGPLPDRPGAARVEGPEDELDRPPQQILEAYTHTSLEAGYASAVGRQHYIGNVGSLATTANVAFNDQHLGSHTSRRRDYIPFLLDWGRAKFMWVQSKVFTDKECGLSVEGSTDHTASWEFFQGERVASWGQAQATSQGDPTVQGACGGQTGQAVGTDVRAGGVVCFYLITFDTRTGVIVGAEFMYCVTGGGELW